MLASSVISTTLIASVCAAEGERAQVALRAAGAMVIVGFLEPPSTKDVLNHARAHRATLMRTAGASGTCIDVWTSLLARDPHCDVVLPVLLSRVALALSTASPTAVDVLLAHGAFDACIRYLDPRPRVAQRTGGTGDGASAAEPANSHGHGCASLHDPVLPIVLEIAGNLLDTGCVPPHEAAASAQPVAALLVSALRHARSAAHRGIRNDAAALLFSLLRRGGPRAAGELADSDQCLLWPLLVAASSGSDAPGADDGDPLGSSSSSPRTASARTSGSLLSQLRLGRTPEDLELLLLLWRVMVVACTGSGADEHRTASSSSNDGCRACLRLVASSDLVPSLLAHLRSGMPAGAGGGPGDALATSTTAFAASTLRRPARRSDAWSPSQQRVLEGAALDALAALAPLAAAHLSAHDAAGALVGYARHQVAQSTGQATWTYPGGEAGAAAPASSSSSHSTADARRQLLQSLRIVSGLAGAGSSLDGERSSLELGRAVRVAREVMAQAAVLDPAVHSAELAPEFWALLAPPSDDGTLGDHDEDAGRGGSGSAGGDASGAQLAGAAAAAVVSSGLLTDLLHVLRHYRASDAHTAAVASSGHHPLPAPAAGAGLDVSDELARTCLLLMTSVLTAPASASHADGVLRHLLGLAPEVLSEGGYCENPGTQRELARLYRVATRAHDASLRPTFRAAGGLAVLLGVAQRALGVPTTTAGPAAGALAITAASAAAEAAAGRRGSAGSTGASTGLHRTRHAAAGGGGSGSDALVDSLCQLSPGRLAMACGALQTLHACVVGDDSAEAALCEAGGHETLMALVCAVPPLPASQRPPSDYQQRLWAAAAAVLADACSLPASQQAMRAWRHPSTGADASVLLGAAWCAASQALVASQAHGHATSSSSASGGQTAALQRLRGLFALLQILTAPSTDAEQSSYLPPSPDAAAAAAIDAELLRESLGRFPELAAGLAWRRAARALAAGAADLPLTQEDAEELSLRLEGAAEALEEEAAAAAARSAALGASSESELLEHMSGLRQIMADAAAAQGLGEDLSTAVGGSSSGGSGGGGGSGTQPGSPVPGPGHARDSRGCGGSVSSRHSRSTGTSRTIDMRLRAAKGGGGGPALFTLDERKAAARARAGMLTSSLVGYRDKHGVIHPIAGSAGQMSSGAGAAADHNRSRS